jgi:hypothetical protein
MKAKLIFAIKIVMAFIVFALIVELFNFSLGAISEPNTILNYIGIGLLPVTFLIGFYLLKFFIKTFKSKQNENN